LQKIYIVISYAAEVAEAFKWYAGTWKGSKYECGSPNSQLNCNRMRSSWL